MLRAILDLHDPDLSRVICVILTVYAIVVWYFGGFE